MKNSSMSIDSKMEKNSAIFIINELNNNEETKTTCSNTDEALKHNGEGIRHDTRNYSM